MSGAASEPGLKYTKTNGFQQETKKIKPKSFNFVKLKTKFTESLSFTYSTNGKRQIQIENFSK